MRFCNDRLVSRIDEWSNNEQIKISSLATHCPEKWKISTTKNRIKDEHKKKTYFRNTKTKMKTQISHESSAYPQRIKNPKKRHCVFQRCQNRSRDQ